MTKDNSPEELLQKEAFLSRWSRRKSDVAVADGQQEIKTLSDADFQGEIVPMNGSDQEQPDIRKELTDKDMPPLDSLTADSDFSMFMSPGVSEALRRLALRKLFGRASFNIRDGLDDYDDDFTSFAELGDIITSDMKHQMELAEERERREAEARTQTQQNESELQDQPDNADDDQEASAEIETEDQSEDSGDQMPASDLASNAEDCNKI